MDIEYMRLGVDENALLGLIQAVTVSASLRPLLETDKERVLRMLHDKDHDWWVLVRETE